MFFQDEEGMDEESSGLWYQKFQLTMFYVVIGPWPPGAL